MTKAIVTKWTRQTPEKPGELYEKIEKDYSERLPPQKENSPTVLSSFLFYNPLKPIQKKTQQASVFSPFIETIRLFGSILPLFCDPRSPASNQRVANPFINGLMAFYRAPKGFFTWVTCWKAWGKQE